MKEKVRNFITRSVGRIHSLTPLHHHIAERAGVLPAVG
ncbi:hypothetical protein CAter282_0288 [Collimonas arenae]|uniref:Uncharacterized protein n=1 Tax=Collimonas arenae TaxID=279058 RepID=A0A127PKF4_9BURK|nr:hypothetical protein CAter10_0304 [Collimonas arenae]AMP08110.1 hypothetical protein CAter282_0288 [Collimonas arenae]